MQLQFVGCGDAFGSGGRFNTCFHIVGEQTNFLIDCGASSLVALKHWGVERDGIDVILVTHFHADHFGGIPFFMLDAQFGKRQRPLVIAGPPGIEQRYVQAMETAFEGSSKVPPSFPFKIMPLGPERANAIGPLAVTPFPVVHGHSGGPFFAYRIEAEGRVIAYSGDTEWTDNLIEAGRDADLFLVEAYFNDRKIKNHLDLKTLETYLPEIKPRKLILTHMSEDMLAHRHDLPYQAAEDGMVVLL
jgi:ribonuclease BN (tRNA processing enzyme)